MSTHKTKLVCFRATENDKQTLSTMAALRGITPSDIFANYLAALLAGDAEIYPPRGSEVAYK